MSDNEGSSTPSKEDELLFSKLTIRKERYWRSIQDCFNLIKQLPEKLAQFNVRVENVRSTREKFSGIIDELYELSLKHDDFKIDIVQVEAAFDEIYYEIMANAGKYSLQPELPTAISENSAPPIQKKQLSMRDIEIPHFDGRPERFPAFQAMFDALVHKTTYSDIEKFTILLNHLEGGALKFAQTVRFSPENYGIVYEQLIERYTNKRIIANHYLHTIMTLNPLKNDTFGALSELCETLQTNVTALKDMKLPDLSDYIFVQFSLRLISESMKTEFEKQCLGTTFPTFDNFIKFMRNTCSVSQLVGDNIGNKPNRSGSNVPLLKSDHRFYNNKKVLTTTEKSFSNIMNKQNKKCCCCLQGGHSRLLECSKFVSLTPHQRHKFVKENKLCYACLYPHFISNCRGKGKCKYCASTRHHSLLHDVNFRSSIVQNHALPVTTVAQINTLEDTIITNTCALKTKTQTLLATAKALVRSRGGQWHPCRLVLDSGSQVNLITIAMAETLGLPRKRCSYEVQGVGGSIATKILGKVDCNILSLHDSNFFLNAEAVVVPRITTELPVVSLPTEIRNQYQSLPLADPEFNVSSPIDLLLGVQAVLDITPDETKLIKGAPTAYFTSLGWVILGDVEKWLDSIPSVVANICVEPEPSLNELLRQFWETEEISMPELLAPEDQICENMYTETVQRNQKGQYVVRLPWKVEALNVNLGNNRNIALNRLLKLESRFKRDDNYYRLYTENMNDYISQGHLIPAIKTSSYIMTHHGVMKHSSSGSQVRVVFNPAEKDNVGHSLNDFMHSGPKLHQDISVVLTRFRFHLIALSCDIRQMFRCIFLHPDDRKFFHIFWRSHPDEPVTEWEHSRVIFGAASSPYLALRTLKQLVQDEGDSYPLASKALACQTFVDDILTGGESREQVEEVKCQLIQLLKCGGFELGKWTSSEPGICEESGHSLEIPMNEVTCSVKVLGMFWDTKEDCFTYKIQDINEPPTKRGLLSRVARTYDINGYLSPFTFLLKCWIQKLWLYKTDWDEPLPKEIYDKWVLVKRELSLIENIRVPRCIWKHEVSSATLFGFSDASLMGMAAVIYLRVRVGDKYFVNLVSAKTRVAPIKTCTIPRLELGAACLLSKLMKVTQQAFYSFIELTDSVCFVDSSTVLGWIGTAPYRLKSYVANRVVQIHENLPGVRWSFVPGQLNPADPASRGLTPAELLQCERWWNGPEFLLCNESDWKFNPRIPTLLPEMKTLPECSLLAIEFDHECFVGVLERASSWLKAQRVLAYVLRFCHNWVKHRRKIPKSEWCCGPLKTDEYQEALLFAMRITQAQFYSKEIQSLKKGLPTSNAIRSLSPFLSPAGYLMVGGRIRHSEMSVNMKHPYLLPNESRLAILLCDYYHIYCGHGGPRLVCSLICRKFWIPSLRRLVRNRIFRCLTCYRFKAKPIQPPMGDLPSYRLEPGRCFTHTGVDYAGPFEIKISNIKSARYQKGYVALFICMVSRAIHLEFVSSLTTEACLASIDRFIARRGLPSHLYSDMGTNFRGASREITQLTKRFDSSDPDICHYLATHGITWHHNPPYAPHMGGLWEAGVKSFKYHLKRIVGNSRLYLETFLTTINRIEAILNSRPFCNYNASPSDDLDPLTPGHFLIGGPLLARHELDLTKVPKNRVNQWQLSQQLIQAFWKRWAREYVHSLQTRPKWTNPVHEIKEGDLVLWYTPQAPPTHWPVGKVIKLIKGADEIARVAKIKTASGEVVRPLNKVAPLPPP